MNQDLLEMLTGFSGNLPLMPSREAYKGLHMIMPRLMQQVDWNHRRHSWKRLNHIQNLPRDATIVRHADDEILAWAYFLQPLPYRCQVQIEIPGKNVPERLANLVARVDKDYVFLPKVRVTILQSTY